MISNILLAALNCAPGIVSDHVLYIYTLTTDSRASGVHITPLAGFIQTGLSIYQQFWPETCRRVCVAAFSLTHQQCFMLVFLPKCLSVCVLTCVQLIELSLRRASILGSQSLNFLSTSYNSSFVANCFPCISLDKDRLLIGSEKGFSTPAPKCIFSSLHIHVCM